MSKDISERRDRRGYVRSHLVASGSVDPSIVAMAVEGTWRFLVEQTRAPRLCMLSHHSNALAASGACSTTAQCYNACVSLPPALALQHTAIARAPKRRLSHGDYTGGYRHLGAHNGVVDRDEHALFEVIFLTSNQLPLTSPFPSFSALVFSLPPSLSLFFSSCLVPSRNPPFHPLPALARQGPMTNQRPTRDAASCF